MKRLNRIIGICGLVLIATACNKKEFCDNLEQHEANVELIYDWSRGCCIPNEVVVKITTPTGEVITEYTPSSKGYLQLTEGTYQILAYESNKNVIIEGDIARSAILSNGSLAEPGEFSSGTGCLIIEGNKSCHSTIIMKRQFQELSLSVDTKGKDASLVTNMEGKLSGTSFARDIRNNCCISTRGVKSSSSLPTNFILFGLEQNGNNFSGSVRFLGNMSDTRQFVSINMTYDDGSKQTVELDVTEQMNAPEEEPEEMPKSKNLSVGLEVEQIKGVFTATITEWKIGNGEDLDADHNIN